MSMTNVPELPQLFLHDVDDEFTCLCLGLHDVGHVLHDDHFGHEHTGDAQELDEKTVAWVFGVASVLVGLREALAGRPAKKHVHLACEVLRQFLVSDLPDVVDNDFCLGMIRRESVCRPLVLLDGSYNVIMSRKHEAEAESASPRKGVQDIILFFFYHDYHFSTAKLRKFSQK